MKVMKINAGASVRAAFGGYMSSKGNTPMAKKKEEEEKMKAGHGGMAHKKKAKKPYR